MSDTPAHGLRMRLPLATFLAAAALFTASEAQAISCTTSVVSPGTATVDIVENDMNGVSASVTVQQDCSMDWNERNAYFCWYIDPPAGTERTDTSFNTVTPQGSRLAWTLEKTAGSTAGRLVRRYGTSGSTAGGGCSNFSGRCVGPLGLTLRFLDRQQQNVVRASPPTYTANFTLRTVYGAPPQGVSIDSWCNNPTNGRPLTSQLQVSANVIQKCRFENLQDIDFGNWGSVQAAQARAGEIQVRNGFDIRCTYETPYNITIDDGLNASSGQRRMKNGNSFLAYELFRSNCSTPWTNAQPVAGIGTTVNSVNRYEICARLAGPLAVAPAAGTYTDLVTLTATF